MFGGSSGCRLFTGCFQLDQYISEEFLTFRNDGSWSILQNVAVSLAPLRPAEARSSPTPCFQCLNSVAVSARVFALYSFLLLIVYLESIFCRSGLLSQLLSQPTSDGGGGVNQSECFCKIVFIRSTNEAFKHRKCSKNAVNNPVMIINRNVCCCIDLFLLFTSLFLFIFIIKHLLLTVFIVLCVNCVIT